MYRTEPREITESFRLERVLKSSRSAIVFRAVEPGTGTAVAIKLIPPSSPANLEACRERFLGAMGVLASAAPAAFPTLLDYGFCPDGSAFMVMEIVEGERLDTLAGAPPQRVLDLALDTVDGLELLAASGVWHGNLAPENLFVLSHAERDRIRILGFGTAAFHGSAAGAGAGGFAEGPAQYAAPELLDPATAAAADWRADLYALAATTCALLQAEIVPADAPVPEVKLPPQVRAALHDPAALQVVLERSLRHDRSARPATFDEFRHSVRRALGPEPAEPEEAEEAAGEGATRTLAINVAALFTPASRTDAAGAEPAPADEAEHVPVSIEDTSPAWVPPAFPPRPDEEAAPEAVASAGSQEPVAEEGGPASEENADQLPLPSPAGPPEAPREAESHPSPPPVVPPAPVPVGPGHAESAGAAPAQHPEAAGAALAASAPAAPAEAGAASGAEAPPEPAAQPAAAPAKPAARPGRKRSALPVVIAAGAVVVLGAAAGLFWMWNQQAARPAPPATPTAPPARPTPSPAPVQVSNAAEQLARAEAAVALGDLPGAAAALEAITPTEVAGLSQAEQERYGTLRTAYGNLRRQAITKEMQRALGAGNLKALGETVRSISREEESTFKRDADFSASLDEARRALTVQATLLKAQRQGDQGQVLQSASVLTEIAPKYAAAVDAREKAAAALERDADALEAKGNFAQAIDRLETIRRSWPARAGLQTRLERVQAEQEADRRLGAVLAQVEQTEAERAPEKGLELLRSLPSDPRTVERVAKVRERLSAQLAQLDAQPPTVALAPGFKLEYKKGEAVTIPLKIQDDHGVKSAQLYARVEGGGRFVELQLKHGSGADWTTEISPSFHQNQTVEFYVTATDHSGHVGQLGKAQEPIKLKRKKNIFGF